MIHFTVFGVQRSGTNFVERLLRDNITKSKPINTWQTGVWKHSYGIDTKPPRKAKEKDIGSYGSKEYYDKIVSGEHPTIYIHKNPYTWLSSITDKSVDITSSYPHVTRPNLSGTEPQFMFGNLNLRTLAQHWNDHSEFWYKTWEESKKGPRPFLVYRYEDLIQSREETIRITREIIEYYKFEYRHPNQKDISIAEKVSQSSQFTEEHRERYIKFQFNCFSWNHIQEINKHLNKELLKKMGYEMIENEDKYKEHKIWAQK